MDDKDKSFVGYSSSKVSSDVVAYRDLDVAVPASLGEDQTAYVVASDASNDEQLAATTQVQLPGTFSRSATSVKPDVPHQISREVDSNDVNIIDSLSSNTLVEKRKKDRRRKDIGTSAVASGVVKPRKKRKQMVRETAHGYPSPEPNDDNFKPDSELDYVKQPRKNKSNTNKGKKQQIKEASTSPNSRQKVSNTSNASTNTRAKKAKKIPKVSSSATGATAPALSASLAAAETPGSGSPSYNSSCSYDGDALGCYSAAQNAVNDMMRKALEEDQYSALGSVVDTDSSDEDEYNAVLIPTLYNRKDTKHITALTESYSPPMPTPHSRRSTAINPSTSLNALSKTAAVPTTQTTYTRLDRSCLIQAMKKRARMEGIKHASVSSLAKFPQVFLSDANQALHTASKTPGESAPITLVPSAAIMLSHADFAADSYAISDDEFPEDDDLSNKGKKHRGGRRKRGSEVAHDDGAEALRQESCAGTTGVIKAPDLLLPIAVKGLVEGNIHNNNNNDDDDDESRSKSASSNATWVQCDRCKKWRRLRGLVDSKKLNLPAKWFCSMNKNDPERSKCTAPEEEYDSALNTAPETAADLRARVHLRVWARRLQCNDAYEAKLPTMTRQKKKSTSSSAKEPYEWIRCCNPSCGKWRSILKFMDKQAIIDSCKNGEWFCVQNTWDEKMASCAAPQENLPAIGCPIFCITEE